MARNVEIKARIADLDELVTRAEAITDHPAQVIEQRDTFFACADGRLKLRIFEDGTGELIHYQRSDASEPRESSYTKTEIPDPAGLRTALEAALGIVGEVKKRRTLYLAGQTRIHIDEVENLGDYMELEVVLEAGQSAEHGAQIAEDLLKTLGVTPDNLVAKAYVDLLQEGMG